MSLGHRDRGMSKSLAWFTRLLICTLCLPTNAANAQAPPLAWAGLEGADLRCADAACNNLSGVVGRVFFFDASDRWANLYDFDRSPNGTITIRESTHVSLAHFERVAVREIQCVLMPNLPRWVTDPTGCYLVLSRERDLRREVALHVWQPTGEFRKGATMFTQADMDVVSRWPKEIQSAVRDQRVLTGMTPQQVAMSRGHPRKRERLTEGTGVSEHWVYWGTDEVVFVNGKVTRMREELRP